MALRRSSRVKTAKVIVQDGQRIARAVTAPQLQGTSVRRTHNQKRRLDGGDLELSDISHIISSSKRQKLENKSSTNSGNTLATNETDSVSSDPSHSNINHVPTAPKEAGARRGKSGLVTTFPPQREPAPRQADTDQHSLSVGTTKEDVLAAAKAHLIKVDPSLRSLIDEHDCPVFASASESNPFQSLVSGILAQQVSGAAANAIKAKFVALFNESMEGVPTFPTPEKVVGTEVQRLRLAGLSQRKAEYVLGLAEKFTSGALSPEMLAAASDQEVIGKLTAVRGLGMWSAEMFLFFGLGRPDVFSVGDLGIQRGMAVYQGKDVAKLRAKGGGKWKYMSESDMLAHAEPFRPYRSLLQWYLWRIEDSGVDITVMQENNLNKAVATR